MFTTKDKHGQEMLRSTRKQYVLTVYDDASSSLQPILTGVPQESILGPLLFFIYMNDIHMASNTFEGILYADDATLISTLHFFNYLNVTGHIHAELCKVND